jgi:hypothetical protein
MNTYEIENIKPWFYASDEAGDNDSTSDDDDEDDLTVIERGKRMAASIGKI